MVKKIGIGLALVVIAFGVFVALQPAEFRIERSVAIAAPAEVIFAQVNDLRGFQEFSPWAKLDPAAKNTFEGPASGVGSVFGWAGNDQVGEGRMTITESQPNERIKIRLEFLKPFASTGTTEFVLTPEADATRITWSMTGENDFVGKAVALLMNMDKMIGSDFEKGLADLKSIAEAKART